MLACVEDNILQAQSAERYEVARPACAPPMTVIDCRGEVMSPPLLRSWQPGSCSTRPDEARSSPWATGDARCSGHRPPAPLHAATKPQRRYKPTPARPAVRAELAARPSCSAARLRGLRADLNREIGARAARHQLVKEGMPRDGVADTQRARPHACPTGVGMG